MKELEHLTPEESRLAELEAIITTGKRSFIEVGNALSEIQANGLYEAKYKTFAKYCEQRWGFSRQYAYWMIQGCDAKKSLPEHVSTYVDSPTKAAAAAKVPIEKRNATVLAAQAKADAEGREMTARDIADELAKSHPIKPDDSEPVDVESEVVESLGVFDVWRRRVNSDTEELLDQSTKDDMGKIVEHLRFLIKQVQKRRSA